MSTPVEISATVLCKSRKAEPTEAQLALNGDGVTVEGEDLTVDVELSNVFDVRVGTPPKAASRVFGGTILTVGFDGSEGREVVFVDTDEQTVETVAGLLYRRLLHGLEVAVRHPTKVGGRVTGESFDIGELLVTPGEVGCADIDIPFHIDLERIVDFSRSEKELLGEQRPTIDMRYVKDGVAVSLELSITPARKHHLLGRFLRRHYEDVQAELKQLTLPTSALRALVTLYSRRGTAKPEALGDAGATSTTALVRGLADHDLVDVDDGRVKLTSRGWILVTECVGNAGVDADPDSTKVSGV